MISKADAATHWTENDEAILAAAEKRIDKQVVDWARTPVTTDLWNIGVTPRIRERLTARYTDGGWSVEWSEGDQRDPGPHITLR
jgi:hypothetical protein